MKIIAKHLLIAAVSSIATIIVLDIAAHYLIEPLKRATAALDAKTAALEAEAAELKEKCRKSEGSETKKGTHP